MSEVLFEKLFSRYGKDAVLCKLTDTKEVNAMNRLKVNRVKVKPQPSDYIVTLQGQTFYAEVKSSENGTSFPFSNIRETQIGWAKRIIGAGGSYFFYILQTRTLAWYRVPAEVVLEAMDQGRSSLKWSELQPYRTV